MQKDNEQSTVFENIEPAVLEKIQNLRLMDDELMTLVFSGDTQATEFLLKILLNREDLKVKQSMTQLQKHNLFGRSVTLDIVAEEVYRQEYNIEIQRASSGAGARRIRYHQAMLDSHTLQKGKKFDELPNLYIIFILEHDLFNAAEAIYPVRKYIDVHDSDGNYLKFDDGCNIMYVNGDYRGDDPLGKLMHDFSTSNADELYYNQLAERVKFFKQKEKGVHMASKIVEEYGDERAAEALKIGIEQGKQDKAIEDARNFLKMKVCTLEQIAQAIGLPLEKVQELAKEAADK